MAISTFSPVGSQSSNGMCVCVCVCACLRSCKCVWVCVCVCVPRCMFGQNGVSLSVHYTGIFMYDFILYYTSVYTHTHTLIFTLFEDHEPMGLKVHIVKTTSCTHTLSHSHMRAHTHTRINLVIHPQTVNPRESMNHEQGMGYTPHGQHCVNRCSRIVRND